VLFAEYLLAVVLFNVLFVNICNIKTIKSIFMKIITLFTLSFLLIGCATAPDKLSTQYIPASTYSNLDCDQIAGSLRQKNGRLQNLYASLDKEASNDGIQMGVGMLLFWPALFFLEGGDSPEAAEYSRLKGEVDALNEASVLKKCGY